MHSRIAELLLSSFLSSSSVTHAFSASLYYPHFHEISLNITFTAPCPAGVPQGSVISPTLFNIHINDLEDFVPEHLKANTYKYADDYTLDIIVSAGEESTMPGVLDAVQRWAVDNKMSLNSEKAEDMWVSFRAVPEPPALHLNDANIEKVKTFKLLGTWLQDDLKWNQHIEEITRKASKRLFCPRECRRAHLPAAVSLTIYTTKIRPLLEYASPVWGGLPWYLAEELESLQRRSLRILGLPKDHLPALADRRDLAAARELDAIRKDTKHPLHNSVSLDYKYTYTLRKNRSYKRAPYSGTERYKNSFVPRAIRLF